MYLDALKYSRLTRVASCSKFESYLVMATISAISTMPFFRPCSSSPLPGGMSNNMQSTMFTTAYSAWPTPRTNRNHLIYYSYYIVFIFIFYSPTVSTIMTSKLAASHRSIVSRVVRVTPPRLHLFGDERMYAIGSTDSSLIRILSPNIEPIEIYWNSFYIQ